MSASSSPPEVVEILVEGPGKNALGSRIMASLRQALADARPQPILLRGAGGAFSAGLDVKEVAGLSPDGMAAFLGGLEGLVTELFHYPGPVVAALEGHAIAGGAVLALCCDHIVATTDPRARIGLNEVAIGLRFPPATLQVLRHRLPRRHQPRLLLGAELHAPADALALGLVDELADDPVAVARQRLATLAAHPPRAYAATKGDLRAGVAVVTPEDTARFAEQVVPAWTSDEVRSLLAGLLSRGKGR